jgi:hypothetical protein
MEVFEPAFRVRVRVTLRLEFYRQSVRLGAKPLETHGQNFSASVRVRVTLRLAVYRQSVRLGAEPLETHCQNVFLY